MKKLNKNYKGVVCIVVQPCAAICRKCCGGLLIMSEWSEKSHIQLGTLLSNDLRCELTRTLYTWRDLGIEDVKDLPATDLITHRVRSWPGTKPWHRSRRVYWSLGRWFWLDRIVQEGIEAGLDESTVVMMWYL